MSGTMTGSILNFFRAVVVLEDPTQAENFREEEQMNLSIKALGDEREYSFSWAADKGIGEQQLQTWQSAGQRVTVCFSSARATPFAMNPKEKGEDGKPKKYPNPGKVLQVEKMTMEVGTVLSFSAFDVQPAGTIDLEELGKKANGAYLIEQTKRRAAGNAKRIAKMADKAEIRKAELKAKKVKK